MNKLSFAVRLIVNYVPFTQYMNAAIYAKTNLHGSAHISLHLHAVHRKKFCQSCIKFCQILFSACKVSELMAMSVAIK